MPLCPLASTAAAAALAVALCAPPAVADTLQAPAVNADARLAADFQERVAAYVGLHRKLEATLPPKTDQPSPGQLDAHQRSLTRLIAQARSRARQGEIFTRESRAYFRRQIARALSGPDGAHVRNSIMDDNPGDVRFAVNGRYPDEVPLSTMPPQLLAALPKLPEELEYRFIGDRLILLDAHAHLVVDYIDGALPR